MGVALLAAAQERGASWPSDIDLWLLFWLVVFRPTRPLR